MKRLLFPALLILTLVVTACSATATPLPSDLQPAPDLAESAFPSRIDEQGAIVFEITPLNLGSPTDTFQFDVKMNTHSIDLSMDLATLATLNTDTGVSVGSTLWDAPRGGHHVEGKLIFPATQAGRPLLESATKLTLTIINVDAPTRIFEWALK